MRPIEHFDQRDLSFDNPPQVLQAYLLSNSQLRIPSLGGSADFCLGLITASRNLGAKCLRSRGLLLAIQYSTPRLCFACYPQRCR